MSVQIIDLIILVMGLSILISAWKKGFLRQLTDLIALIASIGLSVYITHRYALDTQWLFLLFVAMRFVFGLLPAAKAQLSFAARPDRSPACRLRAHLCDLRPFVLGVVLCSFGLGGYAAVCDLSVF